MISGKSNTIPELTFRLCNVENKSQELDDPDGDGDDDGDGCQHDRVIQDGDLVAREGSGGIEGHHQSAVCCVEKTHPSCLGRTEVSQVIGARNRRWCLQRGAGTGKQNREDEDEPDARAFRALDGGNSEECYFRGRVEA
jgi:hypothetical protein